MNCPTGETYDEFLGRCRPCFTNEPCYRNPLSTVEGSMADTATKPFKQLGNTALDILNKQLPNIVDGILGGSRRSNPNVPVTPVVQERNDSTVLAIGAGVAVLLLIIIILLFRVLGRR
ncbi:MAG: hypothetical protein AAF738_08980 [Bacteroidota bacterium]